MTCSVRSITFRYTNANHLRLPIALMPFLLPDQGSPIGLVYKEELS